MRPETLSKTEDKVCNRLELTGTGKTLSEQDTCGTGTKTYI